MSVLLGKIWRVSVLGIVLSLVVLNSGAAHADQAAKQPTGHVPVVEDLVQLLQTRPELRVALERAIQTADVKGIRDMDSFLTYLDDLVTLVPTEHELLTVIKFHYIVNQAPGDQLNRDNSFNAWMKKFVEAWANSSIRPRRRQASLPLQRGRTTISATTSVNCGSRTTASEPSRTTPS